jgi:hypothetical protein
MAIRGLQGTLRDFGIAEILQLIGQQQKTGVLYVKNRSEEVEVSFLEGQVVRALSKTRHSRDLLGTMLVNSGLLEEAQLSEALSTQRRTLKRLGDILVAEGMVSAEQLRAMTQLQTTETVYKLFAWSNGTYEFVQQDVELDPAQGPPIRSESLLLEGFRRHDEWPVVKKKVTSTALTFERVKHLDPPPIGPGAGAEEVDAALDAALETAATGDGVPRSIGRNERLVFKLADPEVTVRRLCEISMLGEFETCKALMNLLEAGYLKPGPMRKEETKPAKPVKDGRSDFLREIGRLAGGNLAQVGIGLFVFVCIVIAARLIGARPPAGVTSAPADASGVRRLFVDTQIARLMSAIEIFRLGHGRYPESLDDLVTERLVDSEELKYPFDTRYHYRVNGDSYVLLPPLD